MIIKFQQGGGLPLVSYTPVITNLETSAYALRPAANTDDKKDLTTKDLMELLKEAALALPNEYDLIINNFLDFALGSPLNTSTIETRYLSALSSLQKAKFNKELFDESLEIVKSKGALNEFAITAQGDLVCVNNEGDYKIMSPEELEKGYRPLTNSELLNLRAYSPDLVFNNNMLSVVLNGISMELVTNYIKNIIDNLSSLKNVEEGFAQSDKLIKGLEDFKKAASYGSTLGDIYKGKLVTENQAENILQALNYIWKTLPKNAKTLLQIKSDGTDKGAFELMQSLVLSKTKKILEFTLDKEKAGDSDDIKQTFVLSVQSGIGGHTDRFVLNNLSNNEMSTDVDTYESIVDKSGNVIGKTSVLDALQKSGLIDITKGISYFGNQLLQEKDLEEMLYDGRAIARAELPVDINGKPDFAILDLLDQFEAEQLIYGKTPEQLLQTEKYSKLKSYFYNGKPNKDKFAPFILLNASTSEELVNINDTNDFIVDKESDSTIYNDLMYHLSEANPQRKDTYKNLDYNDFWGELVTFGSYKHVYSGTLYIPIHMNKQAAIAANKQYSTGTDYERDYLLSLKDYNQISLSELKND